MSSWIALANARMPSRELVVVASWSLSLGLGGLSGCARPGPRILQPCVSPDGRTITYCTAWGKSTDLLALDVSTARTRPVVTRLHGNAGEPAYLSDGRSLVFASDAGGDRGQISRIDLRTGNVTPVLQSRWSDTGPTVGPDNDTLAFVRSTRLRDRSMGGTTWSDADLWIGSLTKGNWRQLTRVKAEAASPAQFSPDGTTLYVGFHSITEADIYAVSVATGATKQITATRCYTTDPAVSPDGSVIVFLSDRANPKDYDSTPLWQMRTDGSGARMIPGPAKRWRGPRFFPDGQSVVCWVDEDGDGQLWRIHLSGSGHSRLR